MAARIRKGDKVIVLTGKDKGRTGEVVESLPNENRVIVSGINMVARHTRPSQADPQGGIKRKEASIHVSNVAHVDPKDGKATRVGFKTIVDRGEEKKVRFSKRSGENIDA
jgi:large subunit ribosomal protein L24